MSIPRFAIERPVTMFMISGVIILLGGISLTRLPVDLMPDVAVCRPSRCASATPASGRSRWRSSSRGRSSRRSARSPASSRSNSTSSEGNSQRPPELRLGHRPQRGRRRRAHAASTACAAACRRTPTRRRSSSSTRTSMPIMGIGVEGDFDRVTLREIAENDLSPRLERVAGVAAVTINGGLRRQIHVELSTREDHGARPVGRSRRQTCSAPRTRTSRSARSTRATAPTCCAARASSRTSTRSATWSCMTRDGVPVYMRDIAEVTRLDRGPPLASCASTASPASACRSPSSRAPTRCRSPTACARRSSASTARSPGIKLQRARRQLEVHRARRSTPCRSTRMIGGVLVIADHLPVPAQLPLDADHLHVDPDLGHRHLRAALLRRLHAEHDDLRRPGARHRHDRRRRDRRAREHLPAHGASARTGCTAAIDGSEEVWSAILASTLTHIAVFVPLLFLTGVSSIMFGQLSVVVIVLAGDVAVRRGHDRAGAVLAAAEAAAAGRTSASGITGRLYTVERATSSNGMDDGYAPAAAPGAAPPADGARRSARRLIVAAVAHPADASASSSCRRPTRARSRSSAELPVGTRIERTEAVLMRLEETIAKQSCPRRRRSSTQAGGGGGGGGFGGGGDATAATSTSAWCRRTSASAQRADRHASCAAQLSRHSRRHRPRPRLGRQPA